MIANVDLADKYYINLLNLSDLNASKLKQLIQNAVAASHAYGSDQIDF